MAVRLLRHARAFAAAAGASNGVVAAVPNARAVVGKIVVVNTHATASSTVVVYAGAAGTVADAIVQTLTLAPGETYTEGGIVLLAGETLTFVAGTANVISVTFFGEEVDN